MMYLLLSILPLVPEVVLEVVYLFIEKPVEDRGTVPLSSGSYSRKALLWI